MEEFLRSSSHIATNVIIGREVSIRDRNVDLIINSAKIFSELDEACLSILIGLSNSTFFT